MFDSKIQKLQAMVAEKDREISRLKNEASIQSQPSKADLEKEYQRGREDELERFKAVLKSPLMEGRQEPGKRFLLETNMTSEAILTALTHIPKQEIYRFEELDKEMKALGNPNIGQDADSEPTAESAAQQIITAGKGAGVV